MAITPLNVEGCIRVALSEVEDLIRAAFAKVGGVAPAGSALDQAGLIDGRDTVEEYLQAGENGLALEHVIYMVEEPALSISGYAYACIEAAGNAMNMDKRIWERIRPLVGPAEQ